MRRTLFIGMLAAILAVPLISAADTCTTTGTNGFVPLACAQGSPLLNSAYSSSNLAQYLQALFNIAISVGAMAAVLQLVRAGYLYMGSADMWSTKGEAKHIMGNAVFGLLILLAVYLILFQINPQILDLNFLKDFSTAPGSSP